MKFYFVVTSVEKIKNVIISYIKFVLEHIIYFSIKAKQDLIESYSLVIHSSFGIVVIIKLINEKFNV